MKCLSEDEKKSALEAGNSLLYGEVLASGISKMLDSKHLNVSSDFEGHFMNTIVRTMLSFSALFESVILVLALGAVSNAICVAVLVVMLVVWWCGCRRV